MMSFVVIGDINFGFAYFIQIVNQLKKIERDVRDGKLIYLELRREKKIFFIFLFFII